MYDTNQSGVAISGVVVGNIKRDFDAAIHSRRAVKQLFHLYGGVGSACFIWDIRLMGRPGARKQKSSDNRNRHTDPIGFSARSSCSAIHRLLGFPLDFSHFHCFLILVYENRYSLARREGVIGDRFSKKLIGKVILSKNKQNRNTPSVTKNQSSSISKLSALSA